MTRKWVMWSVVAVVVATCVIVGLPHDVLAADIGVVKI